VLFIGLRLVHGLAAFALLEFPKKLFHHGTDFFARKLVLSVPIKSSARLLGAEHLSSVGFESRQDYWD